MEEDLNIWPSDGNCGCSCHYLVGVKHIVACCKVPPLRDDEELLDWFSDLEKEDSSDRTSAADEKE